jgi:reversibly glycosylated polypeptide / UDP-arabinopyranose mutase
LNVLVVPSNRPESLHEFLAAWEPWPWDRILVIEDGPEPTIESSAPTVDVYSWREIDAELPDPSIISRKDSGIRAFGFWKAWQLGAETIFTLDDDCHPAGEDMVAGHLRNLYETEMWQSTVPGLRVRGLPYRNLGGPLHVDVSVGLWLGIPDLDAIETLASSGREIPENLITAVGSRVMPSEQYFPMSGMNLAVRREAACLMYYPPMGLDSPYGRFDDIWCGLVLQRILRHLRRSIVCGRPLVHHQRASDPFANLVKEAPGIDANEDIWERIQSVEFKGQTPAACMRDFGRGLVASADGNSYLERWGAAILAWCNLFDEG